MPQFCRHNRFTHLCPICSKENAPASAPAVTRRPSPTGARAGTARRSTSRSPGLRVRRLERAADDGYASTLVPGLRATPDAERLAAEIAFATGRLARLSEAPPGLWGEVANAADVEEAVWLAFVIALLGPLEGEDPWAGIEAARTPWADAAGLGDLDPPTGPRTSYESGRGTAEAYRVWVERSGTQAEAIAGDAAWTPERRFARVFERLALPALHRGARFDFLATLGATGRFPLAAAALGFTGGTADATTLGAKRAFGIGDPMLLERRATDLAEAAGVPIAALDLALASWESGERIHGGVGDDASDAEAEARVRDVLAV